MTVRMCRKLVAIVPTEFIGVTRASERQADLRQRSHLSWPVVLSMERVAAVDGCRESIGRAAPLGIECDTFAFAAVLLLRAPYEAA